MWTHHCATGVIGQHPSRATESAAGKAAGKRVPATTGVAIVLAALLLCGASTRAGTAPGKPQARDCRVLMTAYEMTTSAGPFKATSSAACSFDKGTAVAKCSIEYRDSTGRISTSMTESRFRSLDDLIDEARVVPPLTKSLSSSGTQRAAGKTTTGSQVNQYDASGRLLRTDSNPGQPSASRTAYSDWDSAGRPRVARDTGKGFDNRRDIAYDDSARTRTTRVNGGVVVTVETFDADGNPVQQTSRGGNSENTTVIRPTATQRICR